LAQRSARHKDEAALDMLGSILSSGRGSRLQSNLIYGKQTRAGHRRRKRLARNCRNVSNLLRRVRAKRSKKSKRKSTSKSNASKNEPPTAEEIARALNQIESARFSVCKPFSAKPTRSTATRRFYGKPDVFQQQLDEYRKVTPADVQRVAKTYLTANRLVMTIVPRTEARRKRK
jgi:zinc protease